MSELSHFSNISFGTEDVEIVIAATPFEKEHTPPPELLENQRKLGQECLHRALLKFIPGIKQPPVLISYCSVNGYKNYTCSLAHTSNKKNIHVAVGMIAQLNKIKSVGIDIEFSERIIKKDYQHKFLNVNDHKDWWAEDNLLFSWMAKEACFKAASNFCPGRIHLLQQIFLLDSLDPSIFTAMAFLNAKARLDSDFEGKFVNLKFTFFSWEYENKIIRGCAAIVNI